MRGSISHATDLISSQAANKDELIMVLHMEIIV